MSDRRTNLHHRRAVLRGLGGVSVGLPLLDVFAAAEARAQAAAGKPAPAPSVFVVSCNGVVQGLGRDPEKFWPKATGAVTRASLEADKADRTAGELAEHAESLLFVRGCRHPFGGAGCLHTSGTNQILTATRSSGSGPDALASGESIDNRIARELNPPGREPLTLHAGLASPSGRGYANPGHISYKGARLPRAAEPNPWAAYSRMVGLVQADPALAKQISERRKSVNDLVRGQMTRLLGRTDLSADDRRRLDQHFSALRDLEVRVTSELPSATTATMRKLSDERTFQRSDTRDTVVRLQMDLIVFALAADYTRVATLKIGDNNDQVRYVLDGKTLPPFHPISHRIMGDGASGPPIAGAVDMHHRIDRIQARHFKYLLDRMRAVETPQGRLLDLGFAVWTNQIANGAHDYRKLPHITAGKARGALKTGLFLDVPDVTNNRMLNTWLTAAGVRKAGGAPVDDFGDGGLSKGLLTQVLTTA
jgi:hypothetical protein